MTAFLSDRVLLENDTAAALFEGTAKALPIYDYHCHLSPRMIYEDASYDNIGQLWLEGDHYKWRLMRAEGIDEALITGDASWKDKFFAFASAVPRMAGSPIYHWAHMELKACFGITTPINSRTAPSIWEETSRKMADGSFCARNLIHRFGVESICTTDDPVDTLIYHQKLKDEGFDVKVRPTFRPDAAVCGVQREDFAEYVRKIGAVSGRETDSFDGWISALQQRMTFFGEVGCNMSDLSLGKIPEESGTFEQARQAFDLAMQGTCPNDRQADAYLDYMLRFFAREYQKRGWVMQLHLSAIRNNNKRLFAVTGPDSGLDSVGPAISVVSLSRLLNAIEEEGGLPKTIVYTLNPTAYYEIASMIGNFQGKTPNRLMLGAAWWFCDHLDGIKEQLRITANTGLLGRFTGMLTDSRSFTSYARHEYFRRILCSVVGEWVEQGLYDPQEAPKLIEDICINNAREYFEN